jgi:hypothetical protein
MTGRKQSWRKDKSERLLKKALTALLILLGLVLIALGATATLLSISMGNVDVTMKYDQVALTMSGGFGLFVGILLLLVHSYRKIVASLLVAGLVFAGSFREIIQALLPNGYTRPTAGGVAAPLLDILILWFVVKAVRRWRSERWELKPSKAESEVVVDPEASTK